MKLAEYHRARTEFLEKHSDADEIVCFAGTGNLAKAVYSRINGLPRNCPAVFWFDCPLGPPDDD